MITEALEWLSEKLSDPILHRINETEDCINYMNLRDGTLNTVPKPAKVWRSVVGDEESLNEFMTNHGGMAPTAFVGTDNVVVIMDTDDSQHSNTVSLPLVKHHAWATLKNSVPMTQKRILGFLTVDLFGVGNDSPDLANLLRRVKIEKSEDLDSSINHGDESVSKSIRNKTTGLDELPEFVMFSFAPYLNLTGSASVEDVQVACAVIINAEEATFHIRPLPGELEEADLRARSMVREMVTEALPHESKNTVVIGQYSRN